MSDTMSQCNHRIPVIFTDQKQTLKKKRKEKKMTVIVIMVIDNDDGTTQNALTDKPEVSHHVSFTTKGTRS